MRRADAAPTHVYSITIFLAIVCISCCIVIFLLPLVTASQADIVNACGGMHARCLRSLHSFEGRGSTSPIMSLQAPVSQQHFLRHRHKSPGLDEPCKGSHSRCMTPRFQVLGEQHFFRVEQAQQQRRPGVLQLRPAAAPTPVARARARPAAAAARPARRGSGGVPVSPAGRRAASSGEAAGSGGSHDPPPADSPLFGSLQEQVRPPVCPTSTHSVDLLIFSG